MVLAGLLWTGAGEAQTVCRPNALGGLRCAERPMPRPPDLDVRRSLGTAVGKPAAPPGGAFVPARDTKRLGSTVTDQRLPGTCRPDQLGNLRCR